MNPGLYSSADEARGSGQRFRSQFGIDVALHVELLRSSQIIAGQASDESFPSKIEWK
jgi:hypothetical protein